MKWLLDEMLPPGAPDRLRRRGHDAICVGDVALAGEPDAAVLELAVNEKRVVVTENFADFSALLEQRLSRGEGCVAVVFVRRSSLPRRGALAEHLARHLDEWATGNPDPFPNVHWPQLR